MDAEPQEQAKAEETETQPEAKFTLNPILASKLQKKFSHKKRLAPPRKNLYYVLQIVNTFISIGADQVTSQDLQSAVDELGWREKWNLSPNPIDDNGLRKELACLIGGFGLRLPKVRSSEANVYRLPKEPIGDEYLKGIGINPDLVQKQAVNQVIVGAIAGRKTISFRYRNDPTTSFTRRVLNPHFYGVQSGVDNVEGLQTSGYSSSGVLPAWRVFRLDDMKDIKVEAATFAPYPGFRPEHTKYTNPIEMVK